MTQNFITVTELENACVGYDLSKYTQTTLSGVITRATAYAEDFCEYSFLQEEIVAEKTEGQINPDRDFVVAPKKIPITELRSMTIRKGTFSADVSLFDGNGVARYDIPKRGDLIYVNGDVVTFDSVSIVSLEALRNTTFFVEISYTAGYPWSDRPQTLVDAITLLCQDEISRSFNTSGASELRQGAVTIKYASQTTNQTHKSDRQLDAESKLALYKRVTGW